MDPKPLSFPISRRSLLFTAGSIALTIPLLSACGSGDTDAKGSRSKKGTIAKDGVLTIGAAVSTSNVFPHNFNVFGGGDSAPGNAMFWETLFRISSKDGMKLVPNLAKEVKYTSGGKVATYKLRDDVTWNDGKPFTSKDVAFTYGFIFGPPGQSTEKDFKWLAKPIETPDKHTVVVTYNEPQYTEDIPLSLYFPIYPEHIYSKVDHQNYVDKNPVGTGPGKLKSFAGQLIEIDIRDDYWGKKPKGVKTIKLVPAGTAGNIQSQITQGKVDWAEGGDPGVITSFLPMDKDHNGYNYYAAGSTRGIILSAHSLPTSDVAVRKALRASVDMGVVAKAGGVGYTVPSVTGLDPVIYANMLKPEFKKPMAPDVEAAKKFLKDAGWTVQNGNLCKDGKEYPLQLTIRNDNPVEMATMPIVVSQWKDNLGINVKFTPLPKEVFDPAQAMGEYDMSLWTTNAAGGAVNAYTMYMQTKNYKLGDKKADGNYGRWKCSKEADEAIANLPKVPQDDIKEITRRCQILQQAVYDDAPYIPVQNSGTGGMYTTKKWSGLKKAEDVDYFPRASGYNNMIHTVNDFD